MIKKFLLAVAIAFPMFVSAQTLKVGVVDTNSILEAMPETTAAQNKLAETSKKYEKEFADLQQEFTRLYDEYSKLPADTPAASRERKTAELQKKNEVIEAFQQTAAQDLQRTQNELMQPIIVKVRGAIESVGKEGGYSIVTESASFIYFAAPVTDITPLVKAKLGLK